MNLLVTLLQGEITMEMTLKPIATSDRVDQIYVVRDHAGPELSKVEYHCLPGLLAKSGVVKTVAKLVVMMYIAATRNPSAILSFQSFPHGINAFICGKIFRKPVNVNIMGSPKNWRARKKLIPILKRFDSVTVTGSKSRQYLIEQGFDGNRILILPDSIDTDRFYPQPLPRKYDILTVARLSSEKNLETLLKAVAIVKEKMENVTVGIVGDGPSKGDLEMLSQHLHLKDNVQFLGFRNNTEFYYNSARIYVLTSVTEGLPMAMLEAMACGLPCVVSNIGDISEAAVDGSNAFLVDDPFDATAFAAAIVKLLEDDQLYRIFSENALKIREKYCYQRATEVWEEIFDSLNLEGRFNESTSG
jgi:glycosyltransferase involved in cell wall biosynthesis